MVGVVAANPRDAVVAQRRRKLEGVSRLTTESYVPRQTGFLDSRWLAEALVERESPAVQQEKEEDFRFVGRGQMWQPLHHVKEYREWTASLQTLPSPITNTAIELCAS